MSLKNTVEFTNEFFLQRRDLVATGRNPYFILIPGYRLILAGQEEGTVIKVIITVLSRTKVIQGVRTRVVEEREFENGRITEISRNYYAISKTTNSVFYFGEDVDMFDERGRIVSNEGTWRAGVNGAQAGLIMPGLPLVGARYMQEIAPGIALDRAEILSVTAALWVPAGSFRNVLEIRETTALEPEVIDFKYYARGVGLIRDAVVNLIRFGFVRRKIRKPRRKRFPEE